MKQETVSENERRMLEIYHRGSVTSDAKGARQAGVTKEEFREFRREHDLPPSAQSNEAKVTPDDWVVEALQDVEEGGEGSGDTRFFVLEIDQNTYQSVDAGNELEALAAVFGGVAGLSERLGVRVVEG